MADFRVKFGVASGDTDWDRNLVTTTTTGLKVSDILDDTNTATGISLTFSQAWDGTTNETGNSSSGGWPGGVFDSSFLTFTGAAKTVTLDGFDADEEVTMNFAGHRVAGGISVRDLSITADSTVVYDNNDTTSPEPPATVQLTANGSGVATFTVVKVSGAGYWNGFEIVRAASGDTATVTEGSLTDGGTISGTYTKADQWASSDPDRGTVDGVPLTNFTAAAGVWSADNPDVYSIAEGLTYPTTAAVPDFGTVDVVVSDASYDAPAVSKVFNVKSGWAEVTLATVDTVTTEGLYLRINATVTPDRNIATTEKIYYDTVSGDVTVTDDGLYSLDGATNDFDFAVISATNNVDEAFQFSNLGGGGGGTITRLLTNSLLTNTILKQGNV